MGVPTLLVMIKPASGLCNMRCSYCFYADEMDRREQGSYGIMTEDTLEEVIRKALLFAERECSFVYQGGEPTLAGLGFFRKSMEFLEKHNVNHVRIYNSLQTNGYALDEEWCRFFAENDFLIGLSVDGVKVTHDAYRRGTAGEETYLRVIQAARLLEQHHVQFNVLTVVNGKTAPKIRRIYEQYAKLGFRYQQYITCLDPLGEETGAREYSLTPKVYGQFLIDLFELWDIDLRKGKQPYIRQFENWIGILMGRHPEACDQCGVCNVQNVVEADGSVYPCDFYVLDGYRLGNLKEHTFEEIYERRLESGFLESSRNHDEGCRKCRYFSLCRGGCRRQREVFGSEQESSRNILCEGYRMFFDKYFERMKEIAKL